MSNLSPVDHDLPVVADGTTVVRAEHFEATPLSAALCQLSPPGILIGYRTIAIGDEMALQAAELDDFRDCITEVRRRSGAARILARQLLHRLGHHHNVVLRRAAGVAPVWPESIVGSLAHDDSIAIAAIASNREFCGVGIDVEPALSLDDDLIDVVATARERRRYPINLLRTRLLFSVKEAVYKALNPINGLFLDFHQIEVDIDAGKARTDTGICVNIAFTMLPRVVALAFLPRPVTGLAQASCRMWSRTAAVAEDISLK